MELVMGCQSKVDLQRVEKFVKTFAVNWPDAVDFSTAYRLLKQYRFTTGLSIPDCLIAVQAMKLSATLYSFNVRHFGVISGLVVQQPYQR
jgi:predicted nucleic acid-binding protein